MMDTLFLSNTKQDIERAAAILRDGGLVAMPTETVYGLAADALNGNAVRGIFEAKGRPMDNPLIVHVADFSDIDRLGLVKEVPDKAKKLAEAFGLDASLVSVKYTTPEHTGPEGRGESMTVRACALVFANDN